jgi:hypothetical protein
MRPYEGQRVSAYAQGLLGLVFGVFVIRDPRIVVPVFLGMAWIDPLASYCRKRHWSWAFPAAAYFALFSTTSVALQSFSLPNTVFYGAVATTIAVVVEGPRIPQVDDDLLMQVVPMVVLLGLFTLLGSGLAGP